MGAAMAAIGGLAQLAAEYERADEQRRQEILDQADQHYRAYKESLGGLPAALQQNDRAADAAAAALGA